MEEGSRRTLPLDIIALIIEEVACTRPAPEADDSLFDALRMPRHIRITLCNLCLASKDTLPFAQAGLVRYLDLGQDEVTSDLLLSCANYRSKLRDVEAIEITMRPFIDDKLDLALAIFLSRLERLSALSLPAADHLALHPRLLDAICNLGTLQHLSIETQAQGYPILHLKLPSRFFRLLRVLELRDYNFTGGMPKLLAGSFPHLRRLSLYGACTCGQLLGTSSDRLSVAHLLFDLSDAHFWEEGAAIAITARCAQSVVSLTVRGSCAEMFLQEATLLKLPELKDLICTREEVKASTLPFLQDLRTEQNYICEHVQNLAAPKLCWLEIGCEPATFLELLGQLKAGRFPALRGVMVANQGFEWEAGDRLLNTIRDLLEPYRVELHW